MNEEYLEEYNSYIDYNYEVIFDSYLDDNIEGEYL